MAWIFYEYSAVRWGFCSFTEFRLRKSLRKFQKLLSKLMSVVHGDLPKSIGENNSSTNQQINNSTAKPITADLCV